MSANRPAALGRSCRRCSSSPSGLSRPIRRAGRGTTWPEVTTTSGPVAMPISSKSASLVRAHRIRLGATPSELAVGVVSRSGAELSTSALDVWIGLALPLGSEAGVAKGSHVPGRDWVRSGKRPSRPDPAERRAWWPAASAQDRHDPPPPVQRPSRTILETSGDDSFLVAEGTEIAPTQSSEPHVAMALSRQLRVNIRSRQGEPAHCDSHVVVSSSSIRHRSRCHAGGDLCWPSCDPEVERQAASEM